MKKGEVKINLHNIGSKVNNGEYIITDGNTHTDERRGRKKMDKQKYYEQTNWRGSYPCLLSTDGVDYSVEFDPNYDQFVADDFVIARPQCSDGFPSFSTAEKLRRIVKRMLKMQKNKKQIYATIYAALSGEN